MATDEEILDILLQIRATGQAEAVAVNEILTNTGNVATSTAGQVQGLTAAHEEHAAVLQTLQTYNASYGGQLTAQEAAYARLQLSSKEFAIAERDLGSVASASARAFGSLGDEGARVFDRFSALAGLSAGAGPAGLLIGGGLVAGGVAIEAGKSMIDNADKNEAAQRNLTQAFQSQGKSLQAHQGDINAFLDKNASFITSEYDAKNAIADFTRAGFDWTTTQRLMNDALDLSAAKHIDLGTATHDLIDAENGRTLGLIDLGISLKNIDDPQKEIAKGTKAVQVATEEHTRAVRELQKWEDNHHDRSLLTAADLITEQQLQDNVAAATGKLTTAQQELSTAQQLLHDKGSQNAQMLDQLEGKIKGAHGDISDLQQAQDRLNHSWDEASNKYGPGLETTLAGIIDKVAKDGIPSVETWIGDWQTLGGQIQTVFSDIHYDPTTGKASFAPSTGSDLGTLMWGPGGFNAFAEKNFGVGGNPVDLWNQFWAQVKSDLTARDWIPSPQFSAGSTRPTRAGAQTDIPVQPVVVQVAVDRGVQARVLRQASRV